MSISAVSHLPSHVRTRHDDAVPGDRVQLSRGLTLGPRIDSAEACAQLKEQGFRGLVDLRAEGPGEGEEQAARAGLRAKRIPILKSTHPTEKQVKAFLDFVTTPAHQPVYLHSEAGVLRAGLMCAAYRMGAQGWSPERALAEARNLGCAGPAQQDFIVTLHRSFRTGRIPGYPL